MIVNHYILNDFPANLGRHVITPGFKNRAAARRKNMGSDFFEGGGFSCRILYRMNGLESAMRFLLNLLQESMPVVRINIMCAATDLSVFVPISDTNTEELYTGCPEDPCRSLNLDIFQALCLWGTWNNTRRSCTGICPVVISPFLNMPHC